MASRPYDVCNQLGRDGEYCIENAVVTFDVGFEGVGACKKHLAPVLLWCMHTERGGLPNRSVTAYPTSFFKELTNRE